MVSGGLLVLLVDDDEMVLSSLRRVLERAGHQVITRTSVRDAQEIVGTHELDVVISDYWMLDGTGADVATTVRRERPSARLVFLSGGNHGGFSAQGVAVLQKPVRASVLLDAINRDT